MRVTPRLPLASAKGETPLTLETTQDSLAPLATPLPGGSVPGPLPSWTKATQHVSFFSLQSQYIFLHSCLLSKILEGPPDSSE